MARCLFAVGAMLLLAFAPLFAAAHPDHTSGGTFGLSHFLSDPFHVVLSAAAVALFLCVRRAALRSRARERDGQ